MDQSILIRIIILLILIFLSGFFSASETAFTTANRILLKNLADEGDKRAVRALKILEDQSRMLNTILVANNIVNLTASSLSTTLAVDLIGSYGAGVATFIITFVILVLGEISPKTIATVHAESLSLAFGAVIYPLMFVLTPIVVIVSCVSNGLLKLFRINSKRAKKMTEGELRTLVNVSHEDGVIEEKEKDMIYNVFEFNDSLVKEIMVPRIDMVMIDVKADYSTLMSLYRNNMLTRFPVYEDSNDNIIGFVNMKDILLVNDTENFSIRSVLRTPHYTHEHKNTAELLIEMRDNQVNIAIVLDEYGGAAGMITMEDLLEEIVGEIRDEYDDDESDEIRMISENIYEVDGKTDIDDVNEAIGLELNSNDYETIGGFVVSLDEDEAFPEEGDEYTVDNAHFKVKKMDNNRVEKVLITIMETNDDTPVE